jgi:endonuclease/exonuclease/phosphatase family metal-dependent hydrolase
VTSLRVLSYNVHGLRDDRAALRFLAREAAPDVMVIQEAPGRLRWRTRCAALANDLGLVYAVGGRTALGNLILTSYRVNAHETWCLRYPLTPGRHMRGAAFLRASAGGTPFVVAGSHLSTDAAERPAQAALLAKALAEAGTGAPVLLCADLNEAPGGPAWQALAASGFAPLGGDLPATFPARQPRARIDGLLAGPGVEVASCRVLDGPAARAASDHLPILADLILA